MLGQELKAKWLAALRSDEYVQGRSALVTWLFNGDRLVETRYCCLGVLADIAGAEIPDTVSCSWYSPESTGLGFRLASSFLDDVGLSHLLGPAGGGGPKEERTLQRELSQANDSGATFREIADWIEANIEPNVTQKLLTHIKETEDAVV